MGGDSLHEVVKKGKNDLSIEEIAEWAWQKGGMFKNFFIQSIRNERFLNESNVGHFVIADLLITEAVDAAISTNVDYLIETEAKGLGHSDFRAAIKVPDLGRSIDHGQLAKIHGCFQNEELETVWSDVQLNHEPFKTRISQFQSWMSTQLIDRDLLIIGYWTDWDYVNRTIKTCLAQVSPSSVTLVNPDSPSNLKDKASGLWNYIQQDNSVNFQHVRMGGNEFMEAFWKSFSESIFANLLAKVEANSSCTSYCDGKTLQSSPEEPPVEEMSRSEIYGLRRDFSGRTDDDCVREYKLDEAYHEEIGAVHSILLDRSARMNGRVYEIGDIAVRLINGRFEPMTRVQSRFKHQVPDEREVDAFVSVAITDDSPGKSDIVRDDAEAEDDVVRPGPPEWWKKEDLLDYLDSLDSSEPDDSNV
jgi:hypothetical protein